MSEFDTQANRKLAAEAAAREAIAWLDARAFDREKRALDVLRAALEVKS